MAKAQSEMRKVGSASDEQGCSPKKLVDFAGGVFPQSVREKAIKMGLSQKP
jgi:hypothetical protein